jgi:hypothetical protein
MITYLSPCTVSCGNTTDGFNNIVQPACLVCVIDIPMYMQYASINPRVGVATEQNQTLVHGAPNLRNYYGFAEDVIMQFIHSQNLVSITRLQT